MSITAEKQIRRAERERELAAKEIAAGTVGVVHGLRPVELPDKVDKNAVLVLQTPGVDLEEALKSVDRLGFKYKSMCVLRMNKSASSPRSSCHPRQDTGTRARHSVCQHISRAYYRLDRAYLSQHAIGSDLSRSPGRSFCFGISYSCYPCFYARAPVAMRE